MMKKQYLLLPVGFVFLVIGFYVAHYSSKDLNLIGNSPMEMVNETLSTDYPIGIGFIALGMTCLGIVVIWNNITTKKKSRK